ncbi:hypothetical protein SAMN05216564_10575 [Halopenitus persicus]|uniref:Uncharacterized protein n=1 Tax=Halopenitus persicus TaxID=1048396 RepID=A0A1H3JMG7_9EURY|nr:hypothetical protein SAMN05216564_10575 [Halopenitus persicus]
MSKSTPQIGLPEDLVEEPIGVSNNETTLREAATDLAVAHRELDEYRNGALTLAQTLKELQRTAEAEGNHELATTARNLKESAIAVTERIEG